MGCDRHINCQSIDSAGKYLYSVRQSNDIGLGWLKASSVTGKGSTLISWGRWQKIECKWILMLSAHFFSLVNFLHFQTHFCIGPITFSPFRHRYNRDGSTVAASFSSQAGDISYWRQIHPAVQVGMLMAYSKQKPLTASLFYQWDFHDSLVRGMINSQWSVGFTYRRYFVTHNQLKKGSARTFSIYIYWVPNCTKYVGLMELVKKLNCVLR